jgi:hydroxylamine dehydrogenase
MAKSWPQKTSSTAYDGRTSKHGAFMGGADFVQWHGNYGLLQKTVQLKRDAEELRRQHATRR